MATSVCFFISIALLGFSSIAAQLSYPSIYNAHPSFRYNYTLLGQNARNPYDSNIASSFTAVTSAPVDLDFSIFGQNTQPANIASLGITEASAPLDMDTLGQNSQPTEGSVLPEAPYPVHSFIMGQNSNNAALLTTEASSTSGLGALLQGTADPNDSLSLSLSSESDESLSDSDSESDESDENLTPLPIPLRRDAIKKKTFDYLYEYYDDDCGETTTDGEEVRRRRKKRPTQRYRPNMEGSLGYAPVQDENLEGVAVETATTASEGVMSMKVLQQPIVHLW